MPSGKAPYNKRKNDYVGKYDGSSNNWMTRKATDKAGELRTMMVPQSSNPNETNSYWGGYNPKVQKRHY